MVVQQLGLTWVWLWFFSEKRWAQVFLLHHLVWSQGAAFSLDTCCLFTQHELAIIPLIYGIQVQQPVHAPRMMEAPTSTCSQPRWCPCAFLGWQEQRLMPTHGSCGSSDSPCTLGTVWAATKAAPGSSEGCCPHLPLEPKTAWQLARATGAGAVRSPESTQWERRHVAAAALPAPSSPTGSLASLVGPGFFPVHSRLSYSCLFNLTQPTPVLSLGLTSKAQASASSPRPHQWTRARVGSTRRRSWPSVQATLHFAYHNPLLCSPPRLRSSPSPGWSLCPGGDFLGAEPFLLHSSLLGGTGPVLISFPPFLPFFFFSTYYMKVSLPF